MRLIDADVFFENFPELAIEPYINAPTVKLEYLPNYAGCQSVEMVRVSRPQGEWITVKQDTILGTFEVNNKVCDQCNHATKYEYPFCPWCGADMRGKEE